MMKKGQHPMWQSPFSIKSNMLMILLAITIMLNLIGCAEDVKFSPPPGIYEDTQNVKIEVRQEGQLSYTGADQIFYTLDGTTPHESCLEYTGDAIEISKPTVLKMIYIAGGDVSKVFEATYTIGSGGGGSSSTNRQMLIDWIDHEYLLAELLKYHNNCGKEQNGGGCDEGLLDGLNQTWWICDNYDPVFTDVTPSDTEDNVWAAQPNSDPDQCITLVSECPLDICWYFYVSDCAPGFGDVNQQLNVFGSYLNVSIRFNETNWFADNFWAPVNNLHGIACNDGAGFHVQDHGFFQEGTFPALDVPLSILQNQ